MQQEKPPFTRFQIKEFVLRFSNTEIQYNDVIEKKIQGKQFVTLFCFYNTVISYYFNLKFYGLFLQ